MKIKTQYIASLIAVSLSSAHAAVIAQYDFNTDLDASTADANITAGAVTIGAGISGSGKSGRSGISNSFYARASATSTTSIGVGTSIAADDYFSVTIGADSGYYIDLESITLDYGYTRNGILLGDRDFKAYVFSSFTGFVDADDILGSEVMTTTVTNNSVQYPGGSPSLTVDLSAYSYVWSESEIEFRIYLADTTSNSEYIHRVDNVTLNGTVAVVPEPSSTALLGLGGLSLMLRRKRS
ncbi:MAG: PEP-CTERM sorting domain-containing protein [Akkermansiaceae bacterium]|nr:PEP-CTERM sorting domain-containing protein [Akkermansiaceae bacterium]